MAEDFEEVRELAPLADLLGGALQPRRRRRGYEVNFGRAPSCVHPPNPDLPTALGPRPYSSSYLSLAFFLAMSWWTPPPAGGSSFQSASTSSPAPSFAPHPSLMDDTMDEPGTAPNHLPGYLTASLRGVCPSPYSELGQERPDLTDRWIRLAWS
jgi:hypothetical protein